MNDLRAIDDVICSAVSKFHKSLSRVDSRNAAVAKVSSKHKVWIPVLHHIECQGPWGLVSDDDNKSNCTKFHHDDVVYIS